MATTSETTATTINDTWAIASFSKANEFLGFSSFDTSNVILTNRQSMSIYKVSDQQTVSSFTLKSESSFCLPVVYDHEEEHYVGLVENLGKRRLCVWTNKLSNYKDWKKKLLSTEVTELVEVEKTEPLVVTSNNCVCWLSHVEDTSRCVHLLPPDLRNADVEISQFKSYRWSENCQYGVIMVSQCVSLGRHLVYKLQFNDKQVFGKSTQVFLNYTDVTSVCRVVPHAESNYIATSGKGEILYSTGTSEEVISSLNSQFSTQCVSLHLLDSDQLLIATSHSSTNTG
ncbi:hypothetical protein EB796_010815 [Bugula neritina]|uniref:Nucleolar protein 11 N-terminal domain-containing protein n=1 Tax=Bugula neritina TaxID=10212 RepID=A0A7J7JZV6_BUGNE|nr:hypothetical protein EB796_010815 [Bugula neritina]